MADKLDRKLTNKAVAALLAHTSKKKNEADKVRHSILRVDHLHPDGAFADSLPSLLQKQLVESADPISVMIAIKKIPEKQKQKPILM